jgi:hypothetical protein
MADNEHVAQNFEMTRSHEGMIPIAHLVMTTDPPTYTEQADEYCAAEQVP